MSDMSKTTSLSEIVRQEIAEAFRALVKAWRSSGSAPLTVSLNTVADSLDPPVQEAKPKRANLPTVEMCKRCQTIHPRGWPCLEKPKPQLAKPPFEEGQYVKTQGQEGHICTVVSAEFHELTGWGYMVRSAAQKWVNWYHELALEASPPPPPTDEQKALCWPGARVRVVDVPTDDEGVPGFANGDGQYAGRSGKVCSSGSTGGDVHCAVDLDDGVAVSIWLHNLRPVA